ncbi:MAG: dUTP diphosphatase [Clostridia bacterium]|nr:dUTP diphosphatase [Clostridia bacterium]
MKVNVMKLKKDAILPTRGSASAAGYDLYACPDEEETVIKSGQTVKVGTGLAFQIPEGYFGAIFARSGLAVKGLRPANCVGVADSDYRGEYIVALHNDSDADMVVAKGDRIAQLVVMPYLPVEFDEVKDLEKTERGAGGFGSTGK